MAKRTRVNTVKLKRKLEFSKKIVIWAMILITIYLLVTLIGWYSFNMDSPSEITDMVKLIVSGVIVSYSVKAGAENYAKIRQSCSSDCEYSEGENEDGIN